MSGLVLGSGGGLVAGSVLASGGQGTVFGVVSPRSELVFKRFSDEALARDSELANRVEAMLGSAPSGVIDRHAHVAVAWPIDTVFEGSRFVGLVMPRIDMTSAVELHIAANPSDRSRPENGFVSGFTWRYLVAVAQNLAHAVLELHEAGVVVGDFNERNMLVHSNARVTLIDCDSMQVTDPRTGKSFLCTVGRPEFTPPELQQANWDTTVRSPSSDLYALAIHIHQLLLEGEHPYRGAWTGSGEKPSVASLARDGLWVHGNDARLGPRPSAIDVSLMPQPILALFRRAFVDGATNPRLRPSAEEWQRGMTELADGLIDCGFDPNHVHSGHLRQCPWCTHANNRRLQKLLQPAKPAPSHLRQPNPQPTTVTRPAPAAVVPPRPPPAQTHSPTSAPSFSPQLNWWQRRSGGGKVAVVAAALFVIVGLANSFGGEVGETADASNQNNSSAAQSSPSTTSSRTDLTSDEEALVAAESTTLRVGAGDLGIGASISNPPCDGSYVVFVGAATDPPDYTSRIESLLAQFPSSRYLHTVSTGCRSLRRQLDGNDIYSVYFGPYSTRESACENLRRVGGDAYVKRLDNTTPEDEYWTRENC